MSALTLPVTPGHPEIDDLTLARASRGDPAACRVLVERYQRPIFALLSRLLSRAGRGGLVEDLAQETFLRAFRALPTFRPGGPARPSTWLLTIATRLALDVLRSRAPELDTLDRARGVPSPSRADETVERELTAKTITRAVEALAPEYRAAFLLREAHELSYEEVARALDVDLGTVKSRLSRARAALRVALENLQ
jgi:RNA polymerase sigma-70 factor (ECF subfamily)